MVSREHSREQRTKRALNEDRRARRRAPLDAPALIDTQKSWHRVRCRDVSPGGLGINGGFELEPGTSLELYFELPSGVAVETRARVVRAHDGAYGLSFEGLPREANVALRVYCKGLRH